jgi:hypothetical protein
VDHAAEHGEVHGIGGVEHFPFGGDPRIDQDVVGGRDLQESDVEEEGAAADLFGERLGAEHDCRDGVPDGDMGGDVDLLR